jgi:hypothetical protein
MRWTQGQLGESPKIRFEGSVLKKNYISFGEEAGAQGANVCHVEKCYNA